MIRNSDYGIKSRVYNVKRLTKYCMGGRKLDKSGWHYLTKPWIAVNHKSGFRSLCQQGYMMQNYQHTSDEAIRDRLREQYAPEY